MSAVRELVSIFGFELDKKSERDVENAIQTLRTSIFRVSQVAAASGAAMFGLTKFTANYGDEVKTLSDDLDVSVSTIEAWRLAGERARLTTGQIDSAVSNFSETLINARRGFGSGRQALDLLGVSAEDSEGNLRDNDDVLKDVVDSLGQFEDHNRRAFLAQELFGDSSLRFIRFLGEGSDQLNQARRDVERFGSSLSDAALNDSIEFNDALRDTRLIVSGLRNMIGENLMPTITSLIEGFNNWVMTNRKLIRQKVDVFVSDLVDLLSLFGNFLKNGIDLSFRLFQRLGGLSGVVRILTSVLITMLALKLRSFFAAILTGSLSAAKGIGVLTKAFRGMLFLLRRFALFLVIDEVLAWVTGQESLLGRLLGSYEDVFDKIKNGWRDLVSWLGPNVMDPLIQKFSSIGDFISDSLKALTKPLNIIGGFFGAEATEGISPELDREMAGIPSFSNRGIMGSAATGSSSQTNKNVSVDSNISIQVPEGTSQEQQRELARVSREAVKEQFEVELQQSLTAFPEQE